MSYSCSSLVVGMFERSKLVSGSCFIGFMFIPLQTFNKGRQR
ncbi:hypothetical protein LINPERHAP2_LOCUS26215 [Linum perenne]